MFYLVMTQHKVEVCAGKTAQAALALYHDITGARGHAVTDGPTPLAALECTTCLHTAGTTAAITAAIQHLT